MMHGHTYIKYSFVTSNNVIIFTHWYFVTAEEIVLNSCYVFVGFLAVFLVINMEYKVSKGFSLRFCDFCPQNSCLSSPDLNIFCFTSVFSFFLRYSLCFLRVSRSMGQNYLHLFTLLLRMQALARLIMLLLMTLQFYVAVVISLFFLGVVLFISSTSVKLLQLAFLKFLELLLYEPNIPFCWVELFWQSQAYVQMQCRLV